LLERGNSYLLIELYFDNDKGGDSATLQFKNFFANKKTIDERTHYKKYKDINEMITNYQ